MKRTVSVLMTIVLLVCLAGCAGSPAGNSAETQNSTAVTIPNNSSQSTLSPDRYTCYIKNYVGKNLASVGYTAMNGKRMDYYGNSFVRLVLLTADGEYVDVTDDEQLKNWRITGQSIAPDTEIKYTYAVDSEGVEYDSLINHQSIEEVVLSIAPVGEESDAVSLTAIKASPDRYTLYIRDYVGRTLSQCGYISVGGNLTDSYGNGYVRLAVFAQDGSYVDMADENTLKNYVVTEQNIAPNTELTLTYMTDSDGKEYDNLVESQNIGEIELYVVAADSCTEQSAEPETGDESAAEDIADDSETETETATEGIRPEFKAAMDSYEQFFDEYIDFLNRYETADPVEMVAMLADYTQYMTDFADAMAKLDQLEDEEMSAEEALYYTQVYARISQKLLAVQ